MYASTPTPADSGALESTHPPTNAPAMVRVQPQPPLSPHLLHRRAWVRPLAVLLLALGVVLLALASAQLLSERANDYLLLAWLALWLLLFAGCLLLAGTAHRMAQRSAEALDHWAQRRAQARADARFAALAQHDARLQAELRAQQDAQSVAPTRPAR
ncbi:hypothetical protein SRAA_2140 [Serpentinimonas raichei]|uniref:Uncharacterized protein n=1 Tax=Serpentinimonas raichei TaxID=1458425 RepID=A0A060NSW3_9BURK|nr:hypothetical protein [Serpentinimonas raichei]BAO81994.1 hypothetical protein SRAA_2140 [Serpentinimonas raichei]